MKRNLDEEGKIVEHSKGIGTVNRGMVLTRARELALINGRFPNEVSQSDWEQAKRELLGEEGLVPTETPAELLPEAERWTRRRYRPVTKPARSPRTMNNPILKDYSSRGW